MESETDANIEAWSIEIRLRAVGGSPHGPINIHPGLTILVGPNGSGKTRALREIKQNLASYGRINASGRKVRFLSAGRSSPLEHFRASVTGPRNIETSDAAVGHSAYRHEWWEIESVTGDLLAIDSRPDLKLKVEARLQQLFDRSVELSWSQSGLTLRIHPMGGGDSYAANHEASGILQLVALLEPIHNDEIGALLIDEPEISLHPQHQAFLLEEMKRVAGDPADPGKKLIIFATHSVHLLALRSVRDLPRIAFFNDIARPPAQVSKDEDVLQSTKLAALLTRLSATHRMAMFAQRVLLVEGPSDEIIISQLVHRMGGHLLARNAQILPVTGKGEFSEVAKLFSLMKKQVGVLADLDALSDDNTLVNYFNVLPGAVAAATHHGHDSIAVLDRQLRDALTRFVNDYAEPVDDAAAAYPNWSADAQPDIIRRRVTLARLLTLPQSFGGEASAAALSLSRRYQVLLKALAEVGCFFLRAGAIENYYLDRAQEAPKPNLAAVEAATFLQHEPLELRTRYADAVAALRFIAPSHEVDEDRLLRPKLGAVIAAVFQSMTPDMSDAELNTIARATIGADASVFKLQNMSMGTQLWLLVDISSPLFKRTSFPFEIGAEDNVNLIVPRFLSGVLGAAGKSGSE